MLKRRSMTVERKATRKPRERTRHAFQAQTSSKHIERQKRAKEKEGTYGLGLQVFTAISTAVRPYR